MRIIIMRVRRCVGKGIHTYRGINYKSVYTFSFSKGYCVVPDDSGAVRIITQLANPNSRDMARSRESRCTAEIRLTIVHMRSNE